VGVIVGLDLHYDFDQQAWVGDRKHSFDTPIKRSKARFADLVKNTDRVHLSRSLEGCYVHFMDRDTERFVQSRMRGNAMTRQSIGSLASFTLRGTVRAQLRVLVKRILRKYG
jgi:hypothetical protein